MPVTPFHFGPGLFCKGLAPQHFSLAAFVVTETLVDVETLVNLGLRNWPVHDRFHTLVGSISMGLAASAGIFLAGRVLPKCVTKHCVSRAATSEVSLSGVVLGGLAGGVTASLLDAVMHGDVMPFWPLTRANPLHGMLGLGWLHWGCVAAGVAGAILLLWRGSK